MMPRWQWVLAIVLIGGGIFLQILVAPSMDMEGGSEVMSEMSPPSGMNTAAGAEAEPRGPYRTVALDVTGMT
ncbi:MAG: hypothetical protein ACE5GJ_07200 [Gemmatimonadota bacterium]